MEGMWKEQALNQFKVFPQDFPDKYWAATQRRTSVKIAGAPKQIRTRHFSYTIRFIQHAYRADDS